MLDPDTLAPMLHEFGYLPTQKSIGEGPYSKLFKLIRSILLKRTSFPNT